MPVPVLVASVVQVELLSVLVLWGWLLCCWFRVVGVGIDMVVVLLAGVVGDGSGRPPAAGGHTRQCQQRQLQHVLRSQLQQ